MTPPPATARIVRLDQQVELPEKLPVVALRDLVFFPYMVLPLLIGRRHSLVALDEAEEKGDGLLLLLAQKDPAVEEPGGDDLFRVGTVARAVQITRLQDGTVRVVLEGLGRARVRRLFAPGDTFRARVEPLVEAECDGSEGVDAEVEALARKVLRLYEEYARLNERISEDVPAALAETRDRHRLLHLMAGHLLVPSTEKQAILEAEAVGEALDVLQGLLVRELEILRIEEKLEQQILRQMDQERRQFYLTEQLKAIHQELGSPGGEDWADLERALVELDLPAPVRERGSRELARLKKLNPVAPEAAVIRTYLDWLLFLPWTHRTEDNLDVARAARLLEAAHHGLEEVKERILDHIAVLSLVGELQGPILCLVGPPGVGKTSLGRSIAEAVAREFVRVSLGGVRDEAEIRGHRRTYVGALPGRVIQGMRRSGSKNPVFLLDEVDKLARDFHGDPGAALLEVLDPEQNRTFTDHYLELEFDLSDVLFVATANTLQGIPEPLRDRMEVIRLPGYLDTEKREIARRFLWPRQVERHGLSADAVALEEEALETVLGDYTREAGVRELERRIGRIARKLARQVAEGEPPAAAAPRAGGERLEAVAVVEGAGGEAKERTGAGTEVRTGGRPAGAEGEAAGERAAAAPRRIRREDVRELLGPPPYLPADREQGGSRAGIANGLAWTAAGGEVLDVEVAVLPGSGDVRLTGTLGEVMKESAMAAVTYARSRAHLLGLDPQFHERVDIHIHIPEGATPKDGPSAGITIAVALISALTGRPSRPDVAMTGEITLRGRVLGVGGIKEKAVAALRNGIRRVLLPAANAPELELLPPEVQSGVEFLAVRVMDEVLDAALEERGAGSGSAATLPALGLSAGAGPREGPAPGVGARLT